MLESFSRLKFGLQSFSRYVPLSVVRTLMNSNSSAVLGVETCTATMFFSDIANFTTITETTSPSVSGAGWVCLLCVLFFQEKFAGFA